MPRLLKRTVILCKPETTSGTDAVPTGAANALQIMNMSIMPLDAKNADMNLTLPYFGNSPSLVGPASVKVSFTVPLGGAGLAATAPAWGNLLIACANAETTGLTVPNRVEYLTATDTLKTATIYYYDDGLLHKLVGCFGNVSMSCKSGEVPSLKFDFVGLDGGVSAATNATAVLSNWKNPVAIAKANVTDINLGCTYATGVLIGGTVYSSTGMTVDWGNVVNFVPMLTTEQVVLTDRAVKGTIELDLTAAQEVTQMAAVKANTLQGLGFVIGTTSGNRIMVHMPSVQLINPKKVENNGMRLIGFDVLAMPVAGNDELRLISL